MKKTPIIPILFFLFLFHVPQVFSANLKNMIPISFGSIVACQSGDVVEIDARSGPVESSEIVIRGCSVIEGGHSGEFCVTSDRAGQTINVTYPVVLSLTSVGHGKTVDISDMNTLSKRWAESTAANEDIEFHVGGLLHIESGYPQTAYYSGKMTVVIDIINP